MGGYDHISDSAIAFNQDEVWKVIGENLSQNPTYCIGEVAFMVESNNSDFQDGYGILLLGDEINTNTKYIIRVALEPLSQVYYFVVAVTDKDGNQVIEQNEYSEFLAQYGDVVFTFKDVSGIEIPE